jgi:mannose-1-phosphate guanylyltransferase/phosphomannomutase
LGVETISINSSGSSDRATKFADRLPTAAAKVAELVKAMEADFGAVLDPGAECLYLVDEKGEFVPNSTLLLLLLKTAAQAAKGGFAAVPLHATRYAEQVIGSTGVTVRRTRYSKAALMAEATRPNTVFAGSVDGGYIYPAVLPSMDAIFALGKVLEIVSSSDAPISHLASQFPLAHTAHLVANCPWDLKGAVMRRMTEELREGRVSLVDGIKLFLDKNEWVLVLPDAEEPQFHVYSEAGDDVKAVELAEEYLSKLDDVIARSKSS